ncbi:hypothetical protein NC652_001906 [Populus alba x Populus x berolinensis]|uniref:Uncharacterized protein n=1 Tax=Populus alba x Populus x berolinensis TaxID=444605 RepID=A0AAD6RMG0_9ROSI|nr:hypothetical protein NC652_001906 [Populus alba x Populus x berolinensis]KAJ7011711.1 hypothetical protein NC653_001961 [Populus alba x Populus x berolinensis]KAJ7011714.1 hypothetical protein NC653_001964 [Populus alba x Populus x berolinensis]
MWWNSGNLVALRKNLEMFIDNRLRSTMP